MKKVLTFLLILSNIIVFCGRDKKTTEPHVNTLNEQLMQASLDSLLTDQSYLLGTIGYIQKTDHVPWGGAAGYKDISKSTMLKAEDKFFIGSITKTFTATVIYQLMEEGLGLTSVDVLEIIVQLEKSFKVKIPNEKVRKDAFQTIGSLHAFVNEFKATV